MKRILPIMSAAVAMLAVAACSQDAGTETGADTTNAPIEQESTSGIDGNTAPADEMEIKPAPTDEMTPVEPSTAQ